MSQKQDKKVRRLYRKDLEQKLEQLMNELKLNLDSILKPAPKLISSFIWVSLQKLFLNIQKPFGSDNKYIDFYLIILGVADKPLAVKELVEVSLTNKEL
jgi:hypothetical protein